MDLPGFLLPNTRQEHGLRVYLFLVHPPRWIKVFAYTPPTLIAMHIQRGFYGRVHSIYML